MSEKVLELFAGIGGAAAAFQGIAPVVAAVDINQNAAEVYRRHFPHPYLVRAIEDIDAARIAEWQANIWWVSAPCQPFTRRGNRLDQRDRRCRGLDQVVKLLGKLPPDHFLLENVVGFGGSQAHTRLRKQLDQLDYRVLELHRCPTELGIPNRRPRFYLMASRTLPLAAEPFALEAGSQQRLKLRHFLDSGEREGDHLSEEVTGKYLAGMNVVTPDDDCSNCFTSAYGKSLTKSGSYVREASGRLRRFSPVEVARLLGYPGESTARALRFPESLTDRQLWKLLGNSISVWVVRDLILRMWNGERVA